MTLDLSVTLISALGCSGLTDRSLHGKMGYPRNLRGWQITHLVEAAGFWELCPVRTVRTAVLRFARNLRKILFLSILSFVMVRDLIIHDKVINLIV